GKFQFNAGPIVANYCNNGKGSKHMEKLIYVGSSTLDGHEINILRSEQGSYHLIGYDTPAEDWLLVASPGGTIGAHRRRALEDAAKMDAILKGTIVQEFAGCEGYTTDVVPRYTENRRGSYSRYVHD